MEFYLRIVLQVVVYLTKEWPLFFPPFPHSQKHQL